MTLVNGYPSPPSHSSYTQADLEGTDLDLKTREERIKKAIYNRCYPLAEEYLDAQVYPLHDDTEEAMCGVLGRIKELYKKNFPDSQDQVNATYNFYTFLDPEKDAKKIQRMFEKAKILYEAYREQCINQALPGLPIYIHEKCNLKQEDLPILKTMIENASQFLKENVLYLQFDRLHPLCATRVIHYYLRIPRRIPNSDTFFVLHHLPFKKS